MLHLSIKRFVLICICAAVYGAVFYSLFATATASNITSKEVIPSASFDSQTVYDTPDTDATTPLEDSPTVESDPYICPNDLSEYPQTIDSSESSGPIDTENSCDNGHLNNTSSTENITADVSGPMGEYGRLSIPDLGYSARLSSQTADPYGDGQWIVDEYDHALVCNYAPNYIDGGLLLIADHNTDGFSAIRSAIPGVTTCRIKQVNGTISSYVCSGIFPGHNTTECITDQNYNLVTGNSNQIGMYTCNNNCYDVTIVIWDKL